MTETPDGDGAAMVGQTHQVILHEEVVDVVAVVNGGPASLPLGFNADTGEAGDVDGEARPAQVAE